MSTERDASDDTDDEVERLKQQLKEQRYEIQALKQTLQQDRPSDDEVVELVDQRLEEKASSSTRRNVVQALGIGGAATLLGGTAGAATSSSATQASLAVGDVTTNTYRITDNKYGGPDGAQSELTSELDSGDAGAKYKAQDTGALYHWTGSAWELMSAKTKSLDTDSQSHAQWDKVGAAIHYKDAQPNSAVQAAIDNSYGPVHIHPGVGFFPGSTIQCKPGHYLVGFGPATKPDFNNDPPARGSFLRGGSGADPLVRFNRSTDYGQEFMGAAGILFSGNGVNTLIHLDNVRATWVDQCVFTGADNGSAIKDHCRHTWYSRCEWVQNTGDASDWSIQIDGSDSRQFRMDQCLLGNTNGGIWVTENFSQRMYVTDSQFTALATECVLFRGNTNDRLQVTFEDCVFGNPGTTNGTLYANQLIGFNDTPASQFTGPLRFVNCDFFGTAPSGSPTVDYGINIPAGFSIPNGLYLENCTFQGFGIDGLSLGGVDPENVYISEGTTFGGGAPDTRTFIIASLSANQSLSNNTWTGVAFDQETNDALGELNTADGQITVGTTGWYDVRANVALDVGADQDEIQVRVRNVTDNAVPPGEAFARDSASGATQQDFELDGTVKLTAGKDYEIQVINKNSADTILGASGGFETTVKIERLPNPGR